MAGGRNPRTAGAEAKPAFVTVHGGPCRRAPPGSWRDRVCGSTTAAEARRGRGTEDARAQRALAEAGAPHPATATSSPAPALCAPS
ncbi:hypothetical protein [Streptomyces sp. NPDC059513]|uniref:hypothetical protein n=1 Tax=unclassified Streptomyces TaxID=2593676 RepID=UPI0036A349BF